MRPANIEDMPQLIRMGNLFCHALGEACDDESIERTAIEMINNDNAALFIGEHSVAGAMFFPNFFNQSRWMVQELFWWVDPEARGKGEGIAILDSLEKWAKDKGATRITMVAMASLEKVVGDIYVAHGYTPFEATYVKEL